MQAAQTLTGKIALVTGGSSRIGAEIVRRLHGAGAAVAIHYRNSAAAAETLCADLIRQRADSATLIQADLLEPGSWTRLIDATLAFSGRLDVLINNASSYYATPIGTATTQQWGELVGSNAMAPFFLSQAAAPALREHNGCIVNLVDIHADRPQAGHPVYCMAKAANAMMVKALARDLAPDVRVNGVAPGAALWPQGAAADGARQQILARIPMGRATGADQIAEAVVFMVSGPDDMTGQILAVDGGRSVQQ